MVLHYVALVLVELDEVKVEVLDAIVLEQILILEHI